MDRIYIEPAENGLILRYDDDKIRDANRKSGSKWKDPEVKKVYPDAASMLQDLTNVLPTMKPRTASATDEFAESFAEATTKE